MKSLCAGLACRAAVLVGAAVACLIMLAVPAMAQQPGPPPPVENPSPFADLRDRQQREASLRGAEMMPGKRQPDPRRSQQLLKQVSEDYKQLQVIRNEMIRALTADMPLDYKNIVERTAEINKRASRLKEALALRSPDEDLKKQSPSTNLNDGELKEALINLCNGIITFVESPVFKSPGVVDVQETAKASRLLHSIINLSGGIKKQAGKLGKDQ